MKKLTEDPVLDAFSERDPNRPSFITDQALIYAVEQATGRRRVTLVEAIHYAMGRKSALVERDRP